MFRISIIGSGPAAFYTAQKLLKSSHKIKIDMFEKLPVPFGLIRYGVAPDHPEVKNVIKTFSQVAHHENFRFFGNVQVGHDIRIKEMKHFYHSIVLAYGAAQDKRLGIPGEDLRQVYPAIDLVGWYNGYPGNETFQPDLSGEQAVIIGLGNVSLDIARILLSPIDLLKTTDIPDHVLSQLVASRIKTINLIGRRGPLQVAFTIKEFRELLNLANVKGKVVMPEGLDINQQYLDKLARPRKRLTSLLVDTAEKQKTRVASGSVHDNTRHWEMHFLRSPQAILERPTSPGNVDSIRFQINKLEGDTICETDGTVDMACQMVIRSIGYRSSNIDPDIPFDRERNIIPNERGRVIEEATVTSDPRETSLYCVGWIKRGPTGVIINTLSDAQETCSTILQDMGNITDPRPIAADISDLLTSKGIRYLTFTDWEALDRIETTVGQMKGKPREKLTNLTDMMIAATREKCAK